MRSLVRWRRVSLAAAACGLACATPSRADDDSTGVPLRGLVSQPRGSVRAAAAELDLEGDAVVLRLRLQAASPGAALALQSPLFTWRGGAETYPDRQFPELQARLNGAPLPARMSFAAFAGGRDITPDVASLGLDPFVIAATPPLLDPPPAASSPAWHRLLAERAVQVTDGQAWARWRARRLWRFDLPRPAADTPQDFELSYKARPALALLPAAQLASTLPLARYCISPAQLRERLAPPADAKAARVVRSYAIAVGIDGRAPAPLTVKVSDPGAIFCGAGGQPAFGGAQPAQARADRSGVLHVLRLDPPG